MWTIKQIFDGDYGCEEPGPDDSPKVSVTLVNEAGETHYISVADAWLTAQGLDEGSVWPGDVPPRPANPGATELLRPLS